MRIESAGMNSVSSSTEKVVPRTENSSVSVANGSSGGAAVVETTSTAGKSSNAQETTLEMKQKTSGERTAGERDWISIIERANKAINGANKSFEYSIHEATKQICIKIIDRDTKEVIREIPSEKVLDMVAKMWELNGLFVDERR